MRRRIRLTGRKQLAHSSIEAKIVDVGQRKLVALSIVDQKAFQNFPKSARVKLRLFENKFSETLEFGELGALSPTAALKNPSFAAPSCQLRVVSSDADKIGLLLGSTSSWTMRPVDGEEGGVGSDGILLFQPLNIAPRAWKLELRDDDYPVVYIDKQVPEPRTWVRNDPVFVSCVLPAIVREVFEDILQGNETPDKPWIKDWLDWAERLMPGNPPPYRDDWNKKQEWVEALLDGFCQRHATLGMLLGHLDAGKSES